MEQKTYFIPIYPRAWIQFQADSPLFYIPEVCRNLHIITGNPEDKGKSCPMYSDENPYCFHIDEEGNTKYHTLSKAGRRNRDNIKKYNDYRVQLFILAKELDLQVQSTGMAIYYHLPVPVRWSKKKKAAMHGQWKASRPDVDNYNKGFFDALTGKDELVTGRSGDGKYWFVPDLIDDPKLRGGYIEVLMGQPVYNPYNVHLLNCYQTVEMEDILTRRSKLKARKEELKKQREQAEKADKKKPTPKPLKIDQKQLFKKVDNLK